MLVKCRNKCRIEQPEEQLRGKQEFVNWSTFNQKLKFQLQIETHKNDK